VAVLTDDRVGGRLFRPLLLPLALLAVGLGRLVLFGLEAGSYDAAVGTALFATASFVVVVAVAWWLARRLNLLQSQLQAEHDQLVASTRELHDLRTALDEHAIVASTDDRGRITSVNARFCEISGYEAVELIGKDHRIINSAHHPKSFIRDLWNTIEAGRVWHGEICNRAKGGSLYWVATTIVPSAAPGIARRGTSRFAPTSRAARHSNRSSEPAKSAFGRSPNRCLCWSGRAWPTAAAIT
jgi:PAS domain S-box-containing protein